MSDNDADRNANDSDSASDDGPESDLDTTAKFNRDELVRGWREYEARMPRVVPILKYAARTDMGQVRENNEDKFDFYEPETPSLLAARGSLFAVADGIGGALAGQIASEMMLKNLIAGYYDHPSPDIEIALRDAIGQTNDRIYALAQMIPERSGMGTTLTAAIFIEDRVVVVQVGDSRAYLLRDGSILQVTQDHSWVEEQVRAGVLSRSEAEMSPFRNVITRSVGAIATVQPDFYREQARPGDIWVLCSDGLTGHVEDVEIARIAGGYAPSEAARQLIELANARGGRDNITVFVLSVRDLLEIPAHASTEDEVSGDINTASVPALTENGSTARLQPAAASLSGVPERESEERPRAGWRKIFGR
jgi:protein phosphatase